MDDKSFQAFYFQDQRIDYLLALHLLVPKARTRYLPIGSIVVPFEGSYLESYKVIPKRNYYALGYSPPDYQTRSLQGPIHSVTVGLSAVGAPTEVETSGTLFQGP